MRVAMQLRTTTLPTAFAQIWPSASTGEWVVREGTVGKAGTLRETGLDAATTPIGGLAAPFFDRGFVEVDGEALDHLVVQFPMRDAASDRRLIGHATEWLDAVLDERGLGTTTGHDRGKRLSDGRIVVNVFARVLDAERGASAAMSALRKGRADASRATIATRAPAEDEWEVRYERTSGRLPGAFSL
ncbi:hypothetical protein ACWGJP_13560 [Microbacterium sp. NPDC055903]